MMTKRHLNALLLGLLTAASATLLRAQTLESYTFTTNRVIPDGRADGLHDVQSIPSTLGSISSLKVRLKIDGEFNGDLYAYLRHVQNGTTNFCVLINRPGKSADEPAGYAHGGFDVTLEQEAANGDIHTYALKAVPTGPLTGSWVPDGRAVDPDDSLDNAARTTSLADFNGTSGAGEWTLFLADLHLGGLSQLREWGLDLAGAAYPALLWSNPNDIVYGTPVSATQLNALAIYNNAEVKGSYSYVPGADLLLKAGAGQKLAVTFTPDDAASFLTVSTNVVLNVLPAPLTITAKNASKTYGETVTFAGTEFDATGLVSGDAVSSVTLFSDGANSAAPAGDYAVVPSAATGVGLDNYAISYANGKLTILQAHSAGSLATSANPSAPGDKVTFTMTLQPVAPGAGVPTGPVGFRIDGALAGSTVLSGGVASLTLSNLALGTHTVVAEYAGDRNFVGTTNQLSPSQTINTAPEASVLLVERRAHQGLKVLLSKLLAQGKDADGDALTVNVSSKSANGGSVLISSGWVFYTPAPGDTNTDSFSFILTDSRGGSVTSKVQVAVTTDNDLSQNLTIVDLEDGTCRIFGSGIPNRTYRLQYSDSLEPAKWMDLENASVTANTAGVFEFNSTTKAPKRFYRSVYP